MTYTPFCEINSRPLYSKRSEIEEEDGENMTTQAIQLEWIKIRGDLRILAGHDNIYPWFSNAAVPAPQNGLLKNFKINPSYGEHHEHIPDRNRRRDHRHLVTG
jgi:hypothetical protein